MLSDEEKQAIEYLKARLYGNEDCKFIDVAQSDLRIFLNLIEKQQKEIEELKKPKYVINCKTNEITKLTNDFVSKDKIKAKIKWYEDFRGSILYEKYNYEEFVKDLQSLLEKE